MLYKILSNPNKAVFCAMLSLVLCSCGSEDVSTNNEVSEVPDVNVPAVFDFNHPGIEGIYKPGTAYDGSRFLVAFYGVGSNGSGMYGTFITSDGVQSDVFTIIDSSNLNGGADGPVLAFDGTNYLMVYDSMSRIYGVRITSDGAVLDVDGGFQISNIVYDDEDHSPALAFDGENYLVVWDKGRYSTGKRVFGAFVSPSGIPDNEFSIKSDSTLASNSPAISFDGANYLVSWDENSNTPGYPGYAHIYAARVSKGGTVLDPDGIPVTETDSIKFSVRSTFDGIYHRVSWMDQDDEWQNVYYSKKIAVDGSVADGATTDNGTAMQIITVDNVIIAGEDDKVLWPIMSSNGGINAIANGGAISLAVWDTLPGTFNATNNDILRGVFITKD